MRELHAQGQLLGPPFYRLSDLRLDQLLIGKLSQKGSTRTDLIDPAKDLSRRRMRIDGPVTSPAR
jgi:hypothetical protein